MALQEMTVKLMICVPNDNADQAYDDLWNMTHHPEQMAQQVGRQVVISVPNFPLDKVKEADLLAHRHGGYRLQVI